MLDGVCFDMRIDGHIEPIPVLVAIGVTDTDHKLALGFQAGDKELASHGREFFKDLETRGLNGHPVTLDIIDGLTGLEKIVREEFPKAKVQRCQLHVARNVLVKVTTKRLKKVVANDIRSIFYASSQKNALGFFEQFKGRWEKELPSAVTCLENALACCLMYLHFPEEEWICLRTTNAIERVNKGFKRRTKPMEILAGESSCYNLLAFVCLKIEVTWRSKPIGNVPNNLPFFKRLAENNFTQDN